MRTNKRIFWISNVALIVSFMGVVCFTTLRDCFIVFEVLLNIFISLFAGAFLSSIVAYINFNDKKFVYQRDFAIKYIENVNLIRRLANWFDNKSNIVDDCIKMMSVLYDKKEATESVAKVYIKDLFERIYNVSNYEKSTMFAITDDYCDSIWKCEKICKNGISHLMIKMIAELDGFDYLEKEDLKLATTCYEEGIYDAFTFYRAISKYYKEMAQDKKISQLSELHQKLLAATKINHKIDKIYGNRK